MGAERTKRAAHRAAPRELLALAAGLLSAAVLAFAGLVLVRDPEQGGRVALARLAGDVADGIVAEFRRQGGLPPVTLGERITWTPGVDDTLVVAAPRELATLRAPGPATFDALLAEARRLEVLEQRPADGLPLVLRALDGCNDPARLAEGRLRAIQLAARAGQDEVVREQWAAAQAELAGDEALDGTSVLLLCGLAAAPALDAADRDAAYAALTARWVDGALALPDPVDALDPSRGLPALVPSRRAALRDRVAALFPESAAQDPRWELDARRRQVAALEVALGGLPAPRPDEIVLRKPYFACVARAPARGPLVPFGNISLPVTGGFFDPRACELEFRHARTFEALVPSPFILAFDSEEVGRAERVRDRTPLLGDALGFTLWHPDPEGFGNAESRRAAVLRAGLFLTALFSAGAGLIAAAQLRRARELADARAAFVAGVSHELRTPVSSLLLLTENLQSGVVDSPEARGRYLDLVRREAQRLRRLVDDVLDLARLQRGEPLRLQREDVALPAFAADLVREMSEVAARAGATLRAEVGPLPEGAMLDAEALRRAIGNLVDNALKHSGSHEVGLTIGIEPGAVERLVVRVRDAGRGIAPRDRERVFRPFERLAAASGTGGSGLGLAIGREIAVGHGGTARVEDAAPGACFVLELPLAAEVVA
ncbi:MAG TPA: HAMP domain-containing sensor histidine kinase [Planctomycetota bacterium]|nr:HAMP domain-containing sensor histidine kinase [Planctomycetota bacterium]